MPSEAKFDVEPMIKEGVYKITDNYALRDEIAEKLHQAFYAGVEHLESAAARQGVERDGLRNIHKHFPAEKVDLLEDYILRTMRDELYYWSYRVGAENLGLPHPFYVDHLIVIRVHYPYSVARKAGPTLPAPTDYADRLRLAGAAIKNPEILINQISRAVRKRQKIREHRLAYNPGAYHGEIPTAARSHGPHVDTWYGHSYDGINLWLSIDGVNEDNTVILYPDMFARPFDYDKASMYLAAGYPLPEPLKLKMKPKDLLLFNPETLHGTQVNISEETRVALTTRINPYTPRFNDDAPFNMEHWFSSADLEKRQFGAIKLFAANKYQGEPSVKTTRPNIDSRTVRVTLDAAIEPGVATVLCSAKDLAKGCKVAVDAPNMKLLVFRTKAGVKAFERRCPHRSVDLIDGHHTETQIFCPGHGVAFSTETGASKCADFRLLERPVFERDGQIVLERPAKAAAARDAA